MNPQSQEVPQAAPAPTDEFRAGNFGVHAGPVRERPRRPFHPTKCAFNGREVVGMADLGIGEAVEFVEALLDVIEDNTGVRPDRRVLDFVVNTGTPGQLQNWVFSVRLASPINAAIKLVQDESREWQYTIERSSQRAGVRRPPPTDRPLHPRRHRENAADNRAAQTALGWHGPEPVLPAEPGERHIDL